jgi:hypothetical protein
MYESTFIAGAFGVIKTAAFNTEEENKNVKKAKDKIEVVNLYFM